MERTLAWMTTQSFASWEACTWAKVRRSDHESDCGDGCENGLTARRNVTEDPEGGVRKGEAKVLEMNVQSLHRIR